MKYLKYRIIITNKKKHFRILTSGGLDTINQTHNDAVNDNVIEVLS